jgi:hypothetical protein
MSGDVVPFRRSVVDKLTDEELQDRRVLRAIWEALHEVGGDTLFLDGIFERDSEGFDSLGIDNGLNPPTQLS